MITIFKPIEVTSTTASIELNFDQEAKLYQEYTSIPDKLKKNFILNNLNKLDYLSKAIDINFLLPKYLTDDFLVNNITQTVYDNLLLNNKNKLIEITNWVNSDYNFCSDIIEKRKSQLNIKNMNSEKLFKITKNKIYNQIKSHNKPYELLDSSSKKNKVFFINDLNQIFISFENYQKLSADTAYSEINNMKTNTNTNTNTKFCYICRNLYNRNLYFANKSELCYHCGVKNYLKSKTQADMTSQVVYVSGCRHTVGYQIVLNILRNGGKVIGSSRYPNCALMNYQKELDWDNFKDRLTILYCDFKNLVSVDSLLANLKNLNVNGFINNAFQTVRTSDEYNQKVAKLENELGKKSSVTPINSNCIDKFMSDNEIRIDSNKNISSVLDHKTQWTQTLSQMDATEIIENNLINQTVPTLLFKKLLEYFISQYSTDKKFWLINVNSTEGYHQTSTHIVTGMNKIAMDNLIDRMRIGLPDNIICYNADPGFVTGVLNSNDKPLDSVDGAMRVLYPMMQILNNKLDLVNGPLESINFRHYMNQPRISYGKNTKSKIEIDL